MRNIRTVVSYPSQPFGVALLTLLLPSLCAAQVLENLYFRADTMAQAQIGGTGKQERDSYQITPGATGASGGLYTHAFLQGGDFFGNPRSATTTTKMGFAVGRYLRDGVGRN